MLSCTFSISEGLLGLVKAGYMVISGSATVQKFWVVEDLHYTGKATFRLMGQQCYDVVGRVCQLCAVKF